MPVETIPGVGAVTLKDLNSKGIYKIGDITELPQEYFAAAYGKYGIDLWRKANGEGTEYLTVQREQKSISKETTFSEDVTSNEVLKKTLFELTGKRQVRETQLEAERTVQQKQNELKQEQMNFDTSLEEKRKSLIELEVENSNAEADAKAYELSAVMKALEGIDSNVIQSLANMGMQPDKLIAMAFQGLAEKAEKIGQLNISPDLLHELLKGK